MRILPLPALLRRGLLLRLPLRLAQRLGLLQADLLAAPAAATSLFSLLLLPLPTAPLFATITALSTATFSALAIAFAFPLAIAPAIALAIALTSAAGFA